MISRTIPSAAIGAVALVALIGAGLAVRADPSAKDEPDTASDPAAQALERARDTKEEALQALMTGSPDERLDTARHLFATLELWRGRPDNPSRPLDDLVDGLLIVLRQEPDDWIARTMLGAFLWNDIPATNRLFQEALRSTSINVQATAIRKFTFEEDADALEALESLWERDLPAWLRPRLVEALARQGSAAHLDDFMRLTRDDDPVMREAAIDALARLAREEAVPTLVRVVHDGTTRDRAFAIGALGAFPDSEEAFEEVLRVSRTAGQPFLWSAVRALGRFPRPEAGARLIALLDAPPEPDLRAPLAEALAGSTHPDATAALVRLLHEPDVSPESWIGETTLRALFRRDDADAIPGLQDLERRPAGIEDPDQTGGEGEGDPIGKLVAYLSRDRTDGRGKTYLTIRCSGLAPVSADDPRARHVSPTPPFETTRCWAGPERPGDPERDLRIPAGTLVRITDYFETATGTWVETEGGAANDCWVPLAVLKKGPAPAEPLSWPRHHLRLEFDLANEELRSARALRLAGSRLLSVIEPGSEITGAILEMDALDADQVTMMQGLVSRAPSPLNRALRTLLAQIDPHVTAQAVPDVEDAAEDESDDQDDEESEPADETDPAP